MSQKSVSLQHCFSCMFLAALIFMACLTGSSLRAHAATTVAEGTSKYGMSWTLDSSGTLTIGGTTTKGEAIITSYDTWYKYQDSVKKVVVQSGVTELAAYSFSWYENLTSVTLPSTVTTIGDSAFNYCEELKTVSLSSGVTTIGDSTFNVCISLTGITIPSTVETIGDYAFNGCEKLTSLTIPASVTSIGSFAFCNCTGLKTVTIRQGLTSLGEGVFQYCTGLTSVTLPSGLTGIGRYAFYGCESLESITLPSTLKTIGEYAFCDSAVEAVTLPAAITGIGKYAFGWCENLKYLYIKDGVTKVGARAFYGCSYLEIVRIPKSMKTIEDGAFYTFSTVEEVYYGGTKANWSSVSIGSDNTYLTNAAFTYSSTTSVVVPKTEITELQVKNSGITVRWDTAAAYGTNGYHIYRRTGTSGSYEKIATVQGGSTSYYTDTTVSQNTTYYYKIQGYKSDAKSSYGGAKCVKFVKGMVKTVTSLTAEATYNIGQHEYYNWYNWSQPVNTYLVAVDSGFMRVEYTGDNVVVEYYNSSWQLTSKKTITCELPVFGGFYAGEDAYYLVFGQQNLDEDDNQEVIRIVKYSTSWARNTNASIYGANTYIPFRAGSLSMTEADGYLYIRTCHEMYAFLDGLNHQANMSIVVNESNMTVTGLDCEIADYGSNYVSHSFNQLIITDDAGNLVAADHGDAYPRAVVLTLMEGLAGEEDYDGGEGYSEVNVREISGNTGDNYTGTTLGGLEYSDSSYLVAGASIAMNSSWGTNSQHNIYVTVTSRTNFTSAGTSIRWITSYAEGTDIDVSNPYLVKISDTKFLLMWTENTTTLKYVFLNGKGVKTSGIYSGTAYLSDCQPIYANGYVYWYTTGDSGYNDTTPVLYSIRVSSPSTIHKTAVSVKLEKCSVSYVCNTMDGLKVAWNKVSGATGYYVYRRNSDGTYSSTPTATVTGASTTNWTDTSTLTGGKTYTYKVAAYYKDSTGKVTLGSTGTTKTCMYLKGGEVTKVANLSSGLKVTWAKVAGANGYYVYRKVSGGDYEQVKTVSGGSTLSWTDTTAVEGKTYTYKVSPIYTNSSGNVTKGGAKTTRTYMRLAAPTISSLTNSASKTMTVKWGTKSGVTGYQIQYSTSSSFASGNKTVKVTGATSADKVISGLTKGKTYYVRIQTYKTVNGTTYYSAWGTAKSVKISK